MDNRFLINLKVINVSILTLKKPHISAGGLKEMEDLHPLVNGYQILRFSGNKRPQVETPSGLLGKCKIPPLVIKIYSVLSTRC